jgi:hypothetical protein
MLQKEIKKQKTASTLKPVTGQYAPQTLEQAR